MRNKWLEKRLKELKDKGKSKSGLAEVLGVAPARITEIIAGTRKISTYELPKIAKYLELPDAVVLAYASVGALKPAKIGQVWVKGIVQAGAWKEAIEWHQEDWRPAPVGIDTRYARLEQFGLEVGGASMNLIYPEGSVVVCVSLIELGADPMPGDHVICQRRSKAGIEATVKELQRDEAGDYWLWPRSSDPNFQQPWKLPVGDEFGNDDLRLVALVIGSYVPRPKREAKKA